MRQPIAKWRRYARRAYLAVAPTAIIASQARRRLIQRFASRVGLVYFGAVSQQSDEHRLVRGVTLSPHHQDSHYCIGAVEGHDITFVERTAIVANDKRGTRSHVWHIIVVDLQIHHDLPHIFISPRNHVGLLRQQLELSSPSFREMPPVSLADHSSDFIQKYALFASPSEYLPVVQLLKPEATRLIGAHFLPFALEITSDCIYIYADQQHVTTHLLETMLKNGLWLAKYIESQAY